MASIVTTGYRQVLAQFNKDLLTEQNPSNRFYFVIGRDSVWTDENTPPTPVDSEEALAELREDLIAAKRIEGTSITHVARRNDWTTSTVYEEYDSSIDMHDPSISFIVMTDQYNVYKCIKTARDDALVAQPSTVKPTGTSQNIITTADGYKWKYMLTLSSGDVFDFLTSDWIPVKTLLTDDGSDQYVVQASAVRGAIDNIIITDQGTGYSDTTPPAVVITGDGTGATATCTVSGAGLITDVTITARGSGYTTATVSFDDAANGNAGSGGEARAVYSPGDGHGADPVKELTPGALMFNVRLIRDENSTIPVDDDYRQLAIIHNLDTNTAGIRLKVLADNTGEFSTGETVTGQSSGATGIVSSWDARNRLLYLSGVSGTFNDSEVVEGASSGTTATNNDTSTVNLPAAELVYAADDLDKYSGRVIYFENRLFIERASDQTEQLRTVVQY